MVRSMVKSLGMMKQSAQHETLIMERNEFRDLIARECNRADRNDHIFSMVTFSFDKVLTRTHIYLPVFTKELRENKREFDMAGWVGQNRIGVLLPETDKPGAAIFANRIASEFADVLSPAPEFEIQCYPHSDTPEDEGRGGGSKSRDEQDNVTSPAIESVSATCRLIHSDDNVTLTPAIEQISRAGEQRNVRNVDPDDILAVRRLFVRPMPTWKRIIDIIGSSVILLICSPLFLLMAVYIKMVSPGPIFFKQTRVGFLGRTFTMWKFRTMHVNNDVSNHKKYLAELIKGGDADDKPMVKQEDNPSIIPFGKVVRAASIDELPQLINVFLGEMSMVGPRPPIPYEVEEYLRWHSCRFDTVPGMTGLWQVSGKNHLSFKEMVRLDIRYIKGLSFVQDIKILLKTFPVVVILATEKLIGE